MHEQARQLRQEAGGASEQQGEILDAPLMCERCLMKSPAQMLCLNQAWSLCILHIFLKVCIAVFIYIELILLISIHLPALVSCASKCFI
jgi:hypothetical protein